MYAKVESTIILLNKQMQYNIIMNSQLMSYNSCYPQKVTISTKVQHDINIGLNNSYEVLEATGLSEDLFHAMVRLIFSYIP